KMLFAVSIGMCCGLITLSRPNEIICILIPLLYGVGSFAGLTERFKFIKQQTKGFLLAVSVFIAVGIPQIIYWKALSGKFLFYSYGNEGFDFLHTHLLSGLFSFQNGWLIYTPIMIFAIGGIFLLPRKNGFKIPILLFIPVYVFMIYSYWAWNYFNGFGSRPMVEAYPLLSIPLGYMLQWLFDNAQRKVLSFAVLGFLLLLNIFQLWQYDRGILQTSIVNSTTYLNVFGRTILTPNAVISYDINQFQPENLSLVKTVCTLNFNDSLNLLYKKQSAANYFYLKNSAVEFFNLVELNGQDLKLEEGDFLKITLRAKNEELFDRLKMTSVVAQVNKNKKEVFWKGLLIQNKSNLYNATHVRHNPQDWYTVAYFLCIPPDIMFDSKLNFYLWDPCRCNMLAIDDFTIEIWK
ncbi:MAG TPA: hypothetical protein PLD84_06080, partial [Chitinophagales bacterium]|nr:hypothetical protein [Chitinophagales bacterium]